MDTFDEAQKRKKLTWPVIALMDFVTVIGFDDIIYNFQNQGLAVVSDWILLLILFVVPYELIVGQLGATFSDDGGGLSSWLRHTSGDRMGMYLVCLGLAGGLILGHGLYYCLVLLGSFITLLS